MTSYTVYKILEHENRQLLLISQVDGSFQLAVYNEHEGNTLMRMTSPTLANFERAIAVLKGTSAGDF
jgi:hypothetical protein